MANDFDAYGLGRRVAQAPGSLRRRAGTLGAEAADLAMEPFRAGQRAGRTLGDFIRDFESGISGEGNVSGSATAAPPQRPYLSAVDGPQAQPSFADVEGGASSTSPLGDFLARHESGAPRAPLFRDVQAGGSSPTMSAGQPAPPAEDVGRRIRMMVDANGKQTFTNHGTGGVDYSNRGELAKDAPDAGVAGRGGLVVGGGEHSGPGESGHLAAMENAGTLTEFLDRRRREAESEALINDPFARENAQTDRQAYIERLRSSLGVGRDAAKQDARLQPAYKLIDEKLKRDIDRLASIPDGAPTPSGKPMTPALRAEMQKNFERNSDKEKQELAERLLRAPSSAEQMAGADLPPGQA